MFYTSWYETCSGGLASLKRSLVLLDHTATNRRVYSADMVPVFLQTPDYAGAVLSACASVLQVPDDAGDAATALLQRKAILDSPSHRFRLLMGEAALLRTVGSPTVMAAQTQFLLETLETRKNVEIGLLPLDSQLHTPATNFDISDQAAVDIATVTGFVTATSAEEIALAERTFDLLAAEAAYGHDARVLLNRAQSTHAFNKISPRTPT
ncbi:DUF5753 domain-containing protein [Nocardia sp. NPDC057663]|uniref:DUF5753 domain-containing protein n=1 Tax=Nocardia sp. NPDC057663 TaxID=3346201 RepID=UPI00366BEF6C